MIRKNVERQMVEGTLGKEVAVDSVDVDGEKKVAEKGKEERLGKAKQDGKKKRKGKEEERVKNKKQKENVEKAPTEEEDGDDGFFNF